MSGDASSNYAVNLRIEVFNGPGLLEYRVPWSLGVR
jgi:hypothetical protein